MADQNVTQTENAETFAEELRKAHAPIYQIVALLAGVEALLEKAEPIPDPDGVIWSATELVRRTQNVVNEMMIGLDPLARRAEHTTGLMN